MPPEAIPTMEQLGSVVQDHIAPEAEAPVTTPEPETKAPETKAPETPAKTEPDSTEASVEDLMAAVEGAMEAIEKRKAEKEAEAEADARLTDEERTIRDQQAKIAALEAEKDAAELKQQEAKLVHEIQSTAGKLKMTEDEIIAVGGFFDKNPELLGVWSFERAALKVFPEIEGRLRSAPPAQPRNGAAPGSDSEATGAVIDGGAGGPATPKPFKHNGRRFDYSDITQEVLRSGEAAKLGEYR